MYLVYKHTSPSGRAYTGKTNNYELRCNRHIKAAENGSELTFHKAIRKYGWNNFTHEILIENVETNIEVVSMERYYISFYNTYENGYNETRGGDGSDGFKHSEESKEKMSKIHTNRFKDKSHMIDTSGLGVFKDKNGDSIQCSVNDPRVLSGEFVGYMKGRKFTEEQKSSMKEFRNLHPEAGNAKRIKVCDNDGNVIFISHGQFKSKCKEYGLPIGTFAKSYTMNEKISAIKKGYPRKCDKTRAENYKYNDWWAEEISEKEYDFLSKIIL